MRISYAQNGEDVRAWRALRDVEDLFYVEVGASHPYEDSVTAALSAEGWHGLLIEPEPAAADLLRQARPRDVVVAAAASSSSGVVFWQSDGVRGHGQVSAAGGALTTPAVRLADVLDQVAPKNVHFLSVDVEGFEEQALAGADLDRWQPWVVCVEATAPRSRTQAHQGWEPLLLRAGYAFVCFDGLNRWYVAPGHEDLREAVAEPFGVLDRMLDGWERAEVVDLQARLVEVQEATAGLQARLVEVREATAGLQVQLRSAHEARQAVAAERDAALERERVMLTSKSWRLTAPLRWARVQASVAAQARRTAAPRPARVRQPDVPVDARRRAALLAKVAAARAGR